MCDEIVTESLFDRPNLNRPLRFGAVCMLVMPDRPNLRGRDPVWSLVQVGLGPPARSVVALAPPAQFLCPGPPGCYGTRPPGPLRHETTRAPAARDHPGPAARDHLPRAAASTTRPARIRPAGMHTAVGPPGRGHPKRVKIRPARPAGVEPGSGHPGCHQRRRDRPSREPRLRGVRRPFRLEQVAFAGGEGSCERLTASPVNRFSVDADREPVAPARPAWPPNRQVRSSDHEGPGALKPADPHPPHARGSRPADAVLHRRRGDRSLSGFA